MDAFMMDRIGLMVNNYRTLKRLHLADGYSQRFIAMYMAAYGTTPDIESIQRQKEDIRASVKLFSAFRADSLYFWAALLTLEPWPQKVFSEMKDVYYKMRKAGFSSSAYLTVAAYTIATAVQQEEYEKAISDMQECYRILKQMHPIKVGADDYALASLAAAMRESPIEVAKRTESIYKELLSVMPRVCDRNRLLICAALFALGRDGVSWADQMHTARNMLAEGGVRISGSALPTIAAIIMYSNDLNKDLQEICAWEPYLAKQWGFGNMALSREQRAFMIAVFRLKQMQLTHTASTALMFNQMIGIIITQQAAIAAIAATGAAIVSTTGSGD